MNRLIRRLVREATAPVGEMSTRLFKKAVLFFLGMSCLFVSAIFLSFALFVYLQPLTGNAGAALSLGGLYLGVALICIFLMARERPGSARHATRGLLGNKDNLPPRKAEFAKTIDEAVAPILGILQGAGMERERRALEAGAEIAKQLHPFSLVGVALVAGFVLSRILRRSTSPRA